MRMARASKTAILSLTVGLSSGCATLAHRNTPSDGSRVHCDGGGEYCPWLIGDALLLIPGIVPGVIAFVVDFGTGEWRHSSASSAIPTAPDAMASAK